MSATLEWLKTGLKLCRRGHVQWHASRIEFHESLSVGLKVITWGQTGK